MKPAALLRIGGPPLAVLVLWLLATLVPAVLDSTDEELAAARDEQALLTADLAAARAVPEEADEADQRIALAATAVPDSAELAAFIRTIGDVGGRSGVSVEQVAPLTVASDADPDPLVALPEGTSSITISVGASGTYEQAMTFATELGRLGRLVVIDLLAMTADEENSSRVIIDLELRIFTTDQLVTTELDEEFLEEELPDDGGLSGGGDGPVIEEASGT